MQLHEATGNADGLRQGAVAAPLVRYVEGDAMTMLNHEPLMRSTTAMAELCHDLRQPVATILASAASLQIDPDLNRTSRQAVARIVSEARYISCVCRQLTMGADPPTLVDAGAIVAEAVASSRVCFEGQIDLLVQPLEVIAGHAELRRTVMNILDNACRAAGPCGHVRVEGFGLAGSATIDVIDDGPGFGRAPHGEAGLGLGIAARQLAPYDGDLQVMDRQGRRGGHVRITLPLATFG